MSAKGWQLKELRNTFLPGACWERTGRSRSDDEKGEFVTSRLTIVDKTHTCAQGRSGKVSIEAEHVLLGLPCSITEYTDQMVLFDPKLDNTIGFFATVFRRNQTMPSLESNLPRSGIPTMDITSADTSPFQSEDERVPHKPRRNTRHRWRGVRPGRLIYL